MSAFSPGSRAAIRARHRNTEVMRRVDDAGGHIVVARKDPVFVSCFEIPASSVPIRWLPLTRSAFGMDDACSLTGL
jgi:hypothetical protein